ncbi:hypothetical protein CGCSCA4_v009566 [Colletotrichum siamense]|uniref:Uncharacterized protein n=1 Tax=Colletotrichum siamense TaxID=690259 RepID=A0A9P5EMQ1_COLSI|nr:uncharacterized protein CGCA056_v006061 [Colletotrichum aenigma]KAF4841378.1 hypothetical protein CGCSCA4_v009566 [Colletotrichum siamense]KAH9229890.1 hypothetical protein K456DRAFT_1752686 [Colletotrichum gloeosporioides 23]KAI8170205.1 hypothetical protein K4K50_009539 [Colletotrichum sp. SAR 10_71]KAI8191814.1 hypothetical protein K4K51_009980 [Colletotrichum sp. SAR 10_75]KAI8204910.1 hypothetical protein K4K49_000149 [Colletotrichum sp. SAR 10_70]KAI8205091.1 hypothetical protein KHU
MFSNTRLLLSALAATTLLATSSAVAIEARQGPGPVNEWITVDEEGQPKTITPSVVTSNGARTTLSPPPYSLTGSVFTVTATNGALTTSTGVPPPPQASNTLGFGGVFSVCNNNPGTDAPFCQPRRGSTLHVETTYYITWDTTFFEDPNTPIGIVGYDVSNTGNMDAAPAFSVTNIRGGDGWAYWTPRVGDLEEKDSNNMTLILMYNDPITDEQQNVTGPVFTIRPALDIDGSSSSSPNLVAIILPVILITLAIVGVMLWLCFRRRRRHAAAAAAAAAKYHETVAGPPKSRGLKNDANIQLEPTSPPPHSPGRNVFQEEVRRQERERT